MATAHISNSDLGTIDTFITIAGTIASAGWSGPSGTIDNTGTDGATTSYILGDVIVNFGSSGLVTGTGTPNLGIHVNEKHPNTGNFEATQAKAPPHRLLTLPLQASTTYAAEDHTYKNIEIGSAIIEGEILNNTGTFTPASMTVKLQRHTFSNY